MNWSRHAALACAGGACLAFAGTLLPRALAQTSGTHRLVWHGHTADARTSFGRALSGGGVPRMPEPAIYAYAIEVDFEYVQLIEADGSVSWPTRHLSWTLRGETGDDTVMERCQGGGSLDLGPARSAADLTDANRAALQAQCETTRSITSFRLYGSLPLTPPLPTIPGIQQLDDGCAYREEVGSRRTTVWLTPDVEAILEVDPRAQGPYWSFLPNPGNGLSISVTTRPATPGLFRFELRDGEVSRFPGYTSNRLVTPAWLRSIGMSHLADRYDDAAPDLIFDPAQYPEGSWRASLSAALAPGRYAIRATLERARWPLWAWREQAYSSAVGVPIVSAVDGEARDPALRITRLTESARFFLRVKRFDDARGAAESLLALRPESVHAYTLVGEAFEGLQRYKEAVTAFQTALRLAHAGPEEPEWLEDRILALAKRTGCCFAGDLPR